MIRIITAAALLASLAACNTVQGLGRDVSAGGAVISGAANQARPVRRAPQGVYQSRGVYREAPVPYSY